MSRPAPTSTHRDRDLGQSRSRPFQDESGSILVLFSVFLALFLLCCAIVIDVGYWWASAKKAQIAADACALAAARELPEDWGPPDGSPRTECAIGTSDYVLNNIPDQSDPDRGMKHLWTRVISPYDTKNYQVEATVRLRVRTFFGRIVGLPYVEVERRAVAEQQSGQGKMAIYVNSVDCDPGESLEFNGKNMHIHGWLHTEGGLYVSVDGSQPPQPNFTAEKGSMAFDPGFPGGTTTRCEESINPYNQVADFVPGHPDYLPEGIAPMDWPVWYTPAQFGWYQPAVLIPSPNRCRFKGTKIEVLADKVLVDGSQPVGGVVVAGVIPDGIYCAREFVMNGSVRFKGKITVVAQQITVNGDSSLGLELEPYAGSPDPVIFFTVPNTTGWPSSGSGTNTADDEQATLVCDHTKELQFNTYNSTWSGIVFNPCTKTSINQNNSSGSGAIVTKMLKVNGSGFDFTGDSKFSATILLALVE